MHSPRGLTFSLEAYTPESFTLYRAQLNIIYGLYFGMLLSMLLYNIFLFVILRDKSVLFYVLTLICTICTFVLVSGYGRLYFLPRGGSSDAFAFALAGIPVSTELLKH